MSSITKQLQAIVVAHAAWELQDREEQEAEEVMMRRLEEEERLELARLEAERVAEVVWEAAEAEKQVKVWAAKAEKLRQQEQEQREWREQEDGSPRRKQAIVAGSLRSGGSAAPDNLVVDVDGCWNCQQQEQDYVWERCVFFFFFFFLVIVPC